MRWPWRHEKNETEQAVAESAQRLERAHEEVSLFEEVAQELRRMRQRNNFAQMILRSWGEHR